MSYRFREDKVDGRIAAVSEGFVVRQGRVGTVVYECDSGRKAVFKGEPGIAWWFFDLTLPTWDDGARMTPADLELVAERIGSGLDFLKQRFCLELPDKKVVGGDGRGVREKE